MNIIYRGVNIWLVLMLIDLRYGKLVRINSCNYCAFMIFIKEFTFSECGLASELINYLKPVFMKFIKELICM